MELLADRFLRVDGGTVDLATADDVTVLRAPVAPAAQQLVWAERCAALAALEHPHLATLVDYGLLGTTQRFEAVNLATSSPAWPRRDESVTRALKAVVTFLHAQDRLAGRRPWERLRWAGGQLRLEPDADTGAACLTPADHARLEGERRELDAALRGAPGLPDSAASPEGLVFVPPPAARQLVEMLDAGGPGAWRDLELQAPRTSRLRPLVRFIAREARVRGYAPVHIRALRLWPRLDEHLRNVHLLVIHDSDDTDAVAAGLLARFVVRLGIENARGNIVLGIREDERCREPVLRGAGWSTGRGRGSAYDTGRPSHLRAAALREEAAAYAVDRDPVVLERAPHEDRTSAPEVNIPAGAEAAPSRGDAVEPIVAKALAAASRAQALARRGLHAAAERALRETAGVLRRRGAHADVGDVSLALGRLLLERGRVQDALVEFEAARRSFDRADRPAGAVVAGAYVGLAWTDDGRLAEAEAVLRTAVMGAARLADGEAQWVSQLALARALCWQGRHDEAQPLVGSWLTAPPARASTAWVLAARIALARQDVREAGTSAAAALDAARAADLAHVRARAHEAMAAVQAAVGDLDAARQHVASGLIQARRAHAPLRALRLRLTLLEGLTRAGRLRDARRLAAALGRYRLRSVPRVLKARLQLALADAIGGPAADDLRAEVQAFIRATGARALDRRVRPLPGFEFADDIVALLRISQECEDDSRELAQLCAAVRERVRALTTVIDTGDPEAGWLAVDGMAPRDRLSTAARAIDTGLPMPPVDCGRGHEAAVPVRHGGRTIAALACRWPPDVPIDPERAVNLLSAAAAIAGPRVRAMLDRRAAPPPPPSSDGLALLGISAVTEEVRRSVRRAAASPFPVLIEGESGSGKELVARAVHRESARRERKFCAVNCAALPDDLFEAELFGHARGAYTGAAGERAGLFEEADRGVLFLDEVGDLSPRAQAKLLRAIQDGEVRRVGENVPRRVDVRIVAATNRSLATEATAARFRRDLLYRLDVVRICVPPLRERPEDIPGLTTHFWTRALAETGSRATLAPDTLAALARYDWPGNVRELQNVLAALAVHAPRRGQVGPDRLPEVVAGATRAAATSLEEAREAFERRFVRAALAQAAGHRGRAAAALGLSRQGLAKLMKRLRIEQ